MSLLPSFQAPLRIAIFGASGGIGRAMSELLLESEDVEKLYLAGRSDPGITSGKSSFIHIDITNENEIESAAAQIGVDAPLDMVLVMTGLLHDANISPEKSARQINMIALEAGFSVNCFGPALIARHFLPLLRPDRKTIFAALSARAGSISDNRLGGWYILIARQRPP